MPRLFEQAAETYNRGEEVEFGPVTIGRDIGIQHGKKHLTWDEVESVGAGDGELQLRKRDGGAFSHIRIAISTVPNFEALYMMLEQVLGLGQEPE